MRSLYCLLLLLMNSSAFATHYLGGYIQVTPVAGQRLSYEVTVIMYYDVIIGSGATTAATSLSVCPGDNSPLRQLSRTAVQSLGGISVSYYSVRHTYAGSGVYTIQVTGVNRTPARNTGDGEQSFSLQTTVLVGGATPNQTPSFSLPATGLQVALNQRVALSLSATDPDGDSLSYSLAYPLTKMYPQLLTCTAPTPTRPYQFPNDVRQAGTYRLNPQTGLLNWDVPTEQGQYAIAIVVSERRQGVVLSQTHHELILTVVDRGGTPVAPPAYVPAIFGLVTAIADDDRDGLDLLVSPNPVTADLVQVDFRNRRAEPVTFNLLDNQGRVQTTVRISQPAQHHRQQFDLGGKAAGLYFIRAESGGRQVTRKVVKQ